MKILFQKVKIIIVNHKRELSVKRITKIKFRILYYLRLTYNQTIDSLSYKIDPSTVTVTIKNKVSSLSSLSYDLLNENKLNNKLSVGDVSLSKSEVVVKGSQDNLDKIATVKALVDLNNSDLNDSGTYDIDNVLLVAYDVNGKMMSNIDIVPSTVTATLTLNTYSTSVPISVILEKSTGSEK